jgi:hypothetical protein
MVSNNRLYVIEMPFYVQVAMFFNKKRTNLSRIYAYHNIEKNNGVINLVVCNFYHI